MPNPLLAVAILCNHSVGHAVSYMVQILDYSSYRTHARPLSRHDPSQRLRPAQQPPPRHGAPPLAALPPPLPPRHPPLLPRVRPRHPLVDARVAVDDARLARRRRPDLMGSSDDAATGALSAARLSFSSSSTSSSSSASFSS
ncbi:hypothetical protein VTK26DRAFT_4390 [Humicola hyalothermophila]